MWIKFGLFVLGGWLGATSGMMLYNAAFSVLIGKTPYAETIFVIYMAVFVLIGGCITCYLYTHAIAIGSALIGAYCLVRVRIFQFN